MPNRATISETHLNAGSGVPARDPEPRYLAVGRILRPHGVRGELRVEILTDFPERLAEMDEVYVGAEHRRYPIHGVRFHQGVMLLRLSGCDSRNEAESLRGSLVEIPREAAAPLEEGEYYHFQLVGMTVESDTGEPLGEIVEVLSPPGANDVYVIHGPRGEILLPAIKDVVLSMNISARRMTVHLLPGLVK